MWYTLPSSFLTSLFICAGNWEQPLNVLRQQCVVLPGEKDRIDGRHRALSLFPTGTKRGYTS